MISFSSQIIYKNNNINKTTMNDHQLKNDADNIVVANKKAIDYLQNIEFKTFGKCVFQDKLATVSEGGKSIGELTISIEETIRNEMICYYVHAQSHGELDNVPMGTSVSAYISKGLVTLEQTQHEYIKIPNKSLDKKTVLIKEGDKYIVRRTTAEGQEVQEVEKKFSTESMKGFVSEGSNILLQRVMCQRKIVPEKAAFTSLDTNLSLCTMKYEKLEDSSLNLDNASHSILGIQREQVTKEYIPIMTWQTYFLGDGHMANRITLGSPVKMQLIAMPKTEDQIYEEEKPIPSKKDLHWQEDLQIHSHFLERKAELINAHNTYIGNKPEVRALLGDFCQFVLLRKPDDVCTFASEYFGSFSTKIKSAVADQIN